MSSDSGSGPPWWYGRPSTGGLDDEVGEEGAKTSTSYRNLLTQRELLPYKPEPEVVRVGTMINASVDSME